MGLPNKNRCHRTWSSTSSTSSTSESDEEEATYPSLPNKIRFVRLSRRLRSRFHSLPAKRPTKNCVCCSNSDSLLSAKVEDSETNYCRLCFSSVSSLPTTKKLLPKHTAESRRSCSSTVTKRGRGRKLKRSTVKSLASVKSRNRKAKTYLNAFSAISSAPRMNRRSHRNECIMCKCNGRKSPGCSMCKTNVRSLLIKSTNSRCPTVRSNEIQPQDVIELVVDKLPSLSHSRQSHSTLIDSCDDKEKLMDSVELKDFDNERATTSQGASQFCNYNLLHESWSKIPLIVFTNDGMQKASVTCVDIDNQKKPRKPIVVGGVCINANKEDAVHEQRAHKRQQQRKFANAEGANLGRTVSVKGLEDNSAPNNDYADACTCMHAILEETMCPRLGNRQEAKPKTRGYFTKCFVHRYAESDSITDSD